MYRIKCGTGINFGGAFDIISLRKMNNSFMFIVEDERVSIFRKFLEIVQRDFDILEESLGTFFFEIKFFF